MSTAENGHHPAWYPTQADTCPGCGATHSVQRITGTSPTVDVAMCTACGLHWATTTVTPALSIVGLLPTPQLRTAAFLAALRTEVTRRSGKGPGTMTVTICLPATEVISTDTMASVDTVVWRCRLCDHHGTATHPACGAFRGRRAPDRPAPRHDRHRPRISPGRPPVKLHSRAALAAAGRFPNRGPAGPRRSLASRFATTPCGVSEVGLYL